MSAFGRWIGVPVACAGLFVAGFVTPDLKSGHVSTKPLANLTKRFSKEEPAAVEPGELFSNVFASVTKDYSGSVNSRELKFAAMEGLVGSLGDPHTMFMAPDLATEFKKETSGQVDFVGIGARLQPDPQGAKIVSVFHGTPAFNAGIKSGDIILEVNKLPMNGLPIDKIISNIRGEKGTKVTITVLRASTGQKLTFTMTRNKVLTPTADGFMLDGKQIAYVQVFGFADTTPQQFADTLDTLDAAKPKGLIIDLRGNPGGLLEAARTMLSRYIADKVVVTMRGREGIEQQVLALSDESKPLTYPIAILVNEDSASASEIFAGVMRDYKLATIVGEHTYGKSSVQNLFPMPDGSSAKVTIAKYYLPSGVNMDRKVDEEGKYLSGGLLPDVKVELNLGPATVVGDLKTDNQLQKAVSVIESKL